MGVLSGRCLVIPKFLAPPSGETMRQTPKSFWRCKNVLEVLYHHAKFGGARISPAAEVAKNVEFFSSVCLFVTLLNVRDRAPHFAMKALEYRNYFNAVGYGKVCSCAPVFNCLRLLPIGDTKCRSPKTAKIGVFRQQRATE